MMGFDCPIRIEAEQTVQLSKDFLKSLRKLRRSLHKCRRCAARPECRLLQEWNATVDQAIDEVRQEWAMEYGS